MEMDLFGNDNKKEQELTLIDIYLDLFIELTKDITSETYMKGNVLLNKLLPDTARGTVDLDMGVLNEGVYNKVIRPKLETFAQSCVGDGSYVVRDIADRKSGGVTIKDSKGLVVYSIDISLETNVCNVSVEYSFKEGVLRGSTVEKIVCDKCLSTLSGKRFRRTKDFYDLFILVNSNTTIDIDQVYTLMVDKVGEDAVYELVNNFPFSEEIMVQLYHSWDKLELRTAQGVVLIKPTFDVIIAKITMIFNNLKIKANSGR